tara:strand:- start:770 stop:1453 length:684 start_codon:yes stop_codon:yes gene_type:complete
MIAMQKKKIVLIGGLALGIAAGFLFSGEPAGPLGGKAIDSKHPIDEAESTNSRQAVPRMTNSELYLQSEHDDPSDPRSVTYDPIFILKATGKAPFDVFEAEPFNKQWAEPMRAVVTEHFVDDLDAIGAQVEVESAECRTSSCKVILMGESDELFKINGSWLASFSEATSLGPGPQGEDGMERYYLYLGFSNENRSIDDHLRWYESHRQELIDVLRERGTLPEGLDEK